MRNKEDAQDYRYFPEPDILAIRVGKDFVRDIAASLPKLPDELRKEFAAYGLGATEVKRLVEYKKIADFYAEAAALSEAKIAANLILGEIFRGMQTEEEKERFELKFDVKAFAKLVNLRAENKINAGIQKKVLQKMLESGGAPEDYLSAEDMANVDAGAIDKLCAEAVAANERAVKDYLGGKEQALKALIGFVMKATRGKADSAAVEARLKELICK